MMQDLLRGCVPPLWANFTPFRMGPCQKWEKYRGMFYSTKSSSLEYFLNRIVIQLLNNPPVKKGRSGGNVVLFLKDFLFSGTILRV